MRNSKIVLGILMCFIMIMNLSIVSASSKYVNFNGAWANGSVLYSDVFPTDDYIFTGSNVYPVKPITKICDTVTICSVYNYHYETTCMRYSRSRCTLTIKNKIKDDCKTYKTITKCMLPKIGCTNPVTGTYTNQLSLKLYQYSIDEGNTWNIVPYGKTVIEDSSLQFKLEIPSICSPEYYMNKAILITN